MKPARILFVCLGNICRSPLAEGILRQQAGETRREVTVDSAGTGGWHLGNAPDPRSIAVAERHGIDIGQQRCRRVEQTDFERFDLIFGMDHGNVEQLRLLAPPPAQTRIHLFLDYALGTALDVPDPYYSGVDGFETVYTMLSDGCSSLIGRLDERFS
ncbi:low molecular weight protein-tyrosine-phosphatase [Pararhizobium antarcticum]|uniref:low molecular weight protein-tyrosine-phosphatase n=1 Tax=Pararhizobium antarcticum TaxID=1798805 RepID=UPI0008FFB401|nr:low molecular weight protein-tyrosine-phosphatase [Pararhizobium antarcticum]OJG01284.1 protein tyrosine phosphatase [Rhizobium sp. 58]